MKALFESLAHVHSMKVIHRDVKPGNFLFNLKKKEFMLVDFGLAQIQDETDQCIPSTAAPVDLETEKVSSPGSGPCKRTRDSQSKTPKRCKGSSSPLACSNITNTTELLPPSSTLPPTLTVPMILSGDSDSKKRFVM
jgi:serine/threonine protein kinase